MKLIIETVKRGKRKGDLTWKLIGDNNEFIDGSRPETFTSRAGLEHNIDLVSRIREATVVDLTKEG